MNSAICVFLLLLPFCFFFGACHLGLNKEMPAFDGWAEGVWDCPMVCVNGESVDHMWVRNKMSNDIIFSSITIIEYHCCISFTRQMQRDVYHTHIPFLI